MIEDMESYIANLMTYTNIEHIRVYKLPLVKPLSLHNNYLRIIEDAHSK